MYFLLSKGDFPASYVSLSECKRFQSRLYRNDPLKDLNHGKRVVLLERSFFGEPWSRVAFWGGSLGIVFQQQNPERRASRIRSGKTNQHKRRQRTPTKANVARQTGRTGMDGKHHPLVGVKYLDVPGS